MWKGQKRNDDPSPLCKRIFCLLVFILWTDVCGSETSLMRFYCIQLYFRMYNCILLYLVTGWWRVSTTMLFLWRTHKSGQVQGISWSGRVHKTSITNYERHSMYPSYEKYMKILLEQYCHSSTGYYFTMLFVTCISCSDYYEIFFSEPHGWHCIMHRVACYL